MLLNYNRLVMYDAATGLLNVLFAVISSLSSLAATIHNVFSSAVANDALLLRLASLPDLSDRSPDLSGLKLCHLPPVHCALSCSGRHAAGRPRRASRQVFLPSAGVARSESAVNCRRHFYDPNDRALSRRRTRALYDSRIIAANSFDASLLQHDPGNSTHTPTNG